MFKIKRYHINKEKINGGYLYERQQRANEQSRKYI